MNICDSLTMAFTMTYENTEYSAKLEDIKYRNNRKNTPQCIVCLVVIEIGRIRDIFFFFTIVSTTTMVYRKWRTHQKAILGRLRIVGAKRTRHLDISTCISFSWKSKAMQLYAITHSLLSMSISKTHFLLFLSHIYVYVSMYTYTYMYQISHRADSNLSVIVVKTFHDMCH